VTSSPRSTLKVRSSTSSATSAEPPEGASAGGGCGRGDWEGVCSPAGQHPVCRAGASDTSPNYADSMSPERRPPDVDDEFLTVAEVAAVLKLNQQTIRNWIEWRSRGEVVAALR